MAEQAKAPDNADAYRGLLTHYDAKISLFKEIHPYPVWAFGRRVLVLFGIKLLTLLLENSAIIYYIISRLVVFVKGN